MTPAGRPAATALLGWVEDRLCAEPAAADAFVDAVLGPLLAYDARHQGDLVRTVEVLAGSRWSSSAAARRLFLLRNSVLYRRERIETVSGRRLDDPDERLLLELALIVHRRRVAAARSEETG